VQHSVVQCACAGSWSQRERVPNSLEVLEYLPPIFFSLEMACCYRGRSILANILVFFKYLRILLLYKELQFLEIDRIDEQCVCMEDLKYYLYKNEVNLFNVMPSI